VPKTGISLLSVKNLTIRSIRDKKTLLENISFSVSVGERIGLTGDSGAGKSLLCKAILEILPEGLNTFEGSEIRFQSFQGFDRKVALIPQNPQGSLNPLVTVGSQWMETLSIARPNLSKAELSREWSYWSEKVGFVDGHRIFCAYPHELSGGQLQRLVIAMALCSRPGLIVADEPTTALDPELQQQLIKLILSLAKEAGSALILVSHDLHLIGSTTQRVLHLQDGKLVDNPFLGQKPLLDFRKTTLPGPILLEALELSVSYRKGWFKPVWFPALENVSIRIHEGQVIGIIGKSGSGKSTLARAIVGLQELQHGHVSYRGVIRSEAKRRTDKKLTGQMLFQNPFLSLNPRFTIAQSLQVAWQSVSRPKEEVDFIESCQYWLEEVGLDASYLARRANQLSGGELQRACIARALISNPDLLILDEAIASLDWSAQEEILILLMSLREKKGISCLVISHDMVLIRRVCGFVYVLEKGRIVAFGSTSEMASYLNSPSFTPKSLT